MQYNSIDKGRKAALGACACRARACEPTQCCQAEQQPGVIRRVLAVLLVHESKRPSRITQLPLPIGNMKTMHEDVPISPNPKRESSIQTMDAMN